MALETLGGFEIFPWNKNFETGISEIDSQHKRLVLILNQLAFYLGHKAHAADLNSVFDELAAYADYHFKCEEAIWNKNLKDDQSTVEHKKTHESFMGEVVRLRQEDTLPIDVVIENILKFLSRWLAIHILNTDARMAKTVLGIQVGLSLEQAKAQAESEMTGEKAVLIEAILQMYEQLSARTLALMRERVERKRVERGGGAEGIDNTFYLCCTVDETLNLINWNQNFALLTGYSSEQLASMNFRDFFAEEDKQNVIKNMSVTVASNSVTFDCVLVSKGKQAIDFRFNSIALHGKGDNEILITGIESTHNKEP